MKVVIDVEYDSTVLTLKWRVSDINISRKTRAEKVSFISTQWKFVLIVCY